MCLALSTCDPIAQDEYFKYFFNTKCHLLVNKIGPQLRSIGRALEARKIIDNSTALAVVLDIMGHSMKNAAKL